jgi:dipeptidyl-peptidase-4
MCDGRPLSPSGFNVHGLVDVDDDRLVVIGTSDPMDQHVLRIAWNGEVEHVTTGDSVNSVAARGTAMVVATATAEATGTRYAATLTGASATITSMAERSVVEPKVTFLRVGERRLCAAVLWPTGHVAGSARLPVILTPYAGPHHARVVHAASGFAQDQWIADQGFAVVVIDGVGTPGRGPAWEFGVHLDLANGVLADQVSGLQALAAIYPDLDLDRVGITGWSFGGFLAGLALLERPDLFRAAVAGAPVSDWRLYDTAYSERYLGLPLDAPAAYDASSLLTRAPALDRPLLIIHGLADDNVLAANTLQLSSALLAAGRPHSVLPLSGVTHMTPQEVVTENLMRLEVEFFTTHLC